MQAHIFLASVQEKNDEKVVPWSFIEHPQCLQGCEPEHSNNILYLLLQDTSSPAEGIYSHYSSFHLSLF